MKIKTTTAVDQAILTTTQAFQEENARLKSEIAVAAGAPAVQRRTFVVLVLGYWGRGDTLKEAAEACKEAGGRAKDRAIARLILDTADKEKPSVDGDGFLRYHGELFRLGDGFKLGALLNLE
jgi:hypothetical protein